MSRTKRKRRTDRQMLKHGRSAKRSHRKKGGRTGAIKAKQTPAKRPLAMRIIVEFRIPPGIARLLEIMRPTP